MIFLWPEEERAACPSTRHPHSRQSPPPLFTHRGVVCSLDRGANNAHKRRPLQRCSATRLPRAYRWPKPLPPPPRPPQIPRLGLRSALGRGYPEGSWRLRSPAPHPSEPLQSPKVSGPCSRSSSPASLGVSSASSYPHWPLGRLPPRNPPVPSTISAPAQNWRLGLGSIWVTGQSRPQADLSPSPEQGWPEAMVRGSGWLGDRGHST